MVGPSTKADIGVHCQPAVQSHSHRGTQNLNFRLADYPLGSAVIRELTALFAIGKR